MESAFIFERVEEIVKDQGITQEDIQAHINLHQSTISRFFNSRTHGKVLFYIIQMLIEEYYLNPSWLFLRDNSRQSKYIPKKHR